jgi:hypothetical protein
MDTLSSVKLYAMLTSKFGSEMANTILDCIDAYIGSKSETKAQEIETKRQFNLTDPG